MAWWSKLPYTVRSIVIHTVNCALALLSFTALFKLAHWGLGPGMVRNVLDMTEDVVLVVVYLYFAVVLIYELTQEHVRAFITFVVNFIASHRPVLV
jgi:hypothetical protein